MSALLREEYPGYLRYYDAADFTSWQVKPDFLSVILVEKGRGIVEFNHGRFFLSPPLIICVNPDDRLVLEEEGLKAQVLEFRPNIVNEKLSFSKMRTDRSVTTVADRMDLDTFRPFLKRDGDKPGVFSVGPATFKRACQLMEAVGTEITQQPDGFWPCRSRSWLLELLFLVLRVYTAEDGSSDQAVLKDGSNAEVEALILYISENYHQKITVNDLTRMFKMNRNSLYKRFQEVTGVPLITYLIRLRMNMAATFLKETSLPVAEIMERVGYSDLTNFGRAFKKQMGMTPLEYRQSLKSKLI